MHYIDDEFFNISFESSSKEARTANEIEKFKSFELNMRFYIIMVEFVFLSLKNIDSTL